MKISNEQQEPQAVGEIAERWNRLCDENARLHAENARLEAELSFALERIANKDIEIARLRVKRKPVAWAWTDNMGNPQLGWENPDSILATDVTALFDGHPPTMMTRPA